MEALADPGNIPVTRLPALVENNTILNWGKREKNCRYHELAKKPYNSTYQMFSSVSRIHLGGIRWKRHSEILPEYYEIEVDC